MREGRPSITASFVACARGAAGLDPFAERLVPGVVLAALARPHPGIRSLGSVDLMRVRTLAIDEAVQDAARAGSKQVVVLGAGLCARAWRIPDLSSSVVYEVDHPATQRYKQTRLEGLEPKAREVRFVSVDFEKDDLARELEKAGHDRTTLTTWIWEGVTPYLTPSAIASTLDVIRARSAENSVLVLTYYTRAEMRGAVRTRVLRGIARMFVAIGEPLRGLTTVTEMHELLAERGFAVRSDATNRELARQWGGKNLALDMTERLMVERIVVATAEPRAA